MEHTHFRNLNTRSLQQMIAIGINEARWEKIWARRGIGGLAVEDVPITDAITIADNPIQCNTVDNAKAWASRRGRAYQPTHRLIHVAVLPNGVCYKLDGHTRTHMWNADMLDMPPDMCVDIEVYGCVNLAEVESLYRLFDNNEAVKNAKDYLASAYNKHDLHAKSGLIARGHIGSALKMAFQFTQHGIVAGTYTKIDVMDAYAEFDREVRILDLAAPSNDRFLTPITAAALVTIRKYGVYLIDEFWKPYQNDAGVSLGRGRDDAIFKLTERRQNIRRSKLNPTGYQVDLFHEALRFVRMNRDRVETGRDLCFVKSAYTNITLCEFYSSAPTPILPPAAARN
jgi:hypothetical protein